MKILSLLLAILFSSAAFAVTYQLPTTEEITSKSYGDHPKPLIITGTDPTTGYSTGLVFAWTAQSPGGRGSGSTYFAGCVQTVWDGNGVLISYQVIEQEESRSPISDSWCFDLANGTS